MIRALLIALLVTAILPGWVSGALLPEAVDLYPGVDITTWPDAPFRWKDIATTLYAAEYRDSYDYAQAEVHVSFESGPALTFTGRLTAHDLKPNFAYQVKLVGKPTALWGAEGDDLANVKLGYTGRWWRNQPDPGNSSDAEYEAHQDDPDWIFEGYLLFDFFVTDHLGAAELDFALDSSFHVLWWQHQRTPGLCDSPVLWHTVVGHPTDPAYDIEVGPVELGVYAEIERLCDGDSRLPPGEYRCRFLLTEESFHQSGGDEGYWASALVNDGLFFEIVDLTGVASDSEPGTEGWSCAWPNPAQRETVLSCQLMRPGRLRLTIHDLLGRELRRLERVAAAPGLQQLVWDGQDAQGRRLPAGVYLYRFSAPGQIDGGGKLVLLR